MAASSPNGAVGAAATRRPAAPCGDEDPFCRETRRSRCSAEGECGTGKGADADTDGDECMAERTARGSNVAEERAACEGDSCCCCCCCSLNPKLAPGAGAPAPAGVAGALGWSCKSGVAEKIARTSERALASVVLDGDRNGPDEFPLPGCAATAWLGTKGTAEEKLKLRGRSRPLPLLLPPPLPWPLRRCCGGLDDDPAPAPVAAAVAVATVAAGVMGERSVKSSRVSTGLHWCWNGAPPVVLALGKAVPVPLPVPVPGPPPPSVANAEPPGARPTPSRRQGGTFRSRPAPSE